ncbi:Spore cortex-lytic enzyme [Anoxybacillus sp. P3H1B]|uniref:Cell wall hydrolase n=1 Tax=Anoxybacteroides rupiense TaxID=311460 RepID=A0ABD5J263_9BACL|nr:MULTISPECIES: cell wall hydrolase [Anoxybacillus]KXG10699.1 Spore cortex-lytic enzyme [Anoxybacillus sp. P3H1B]MBB3906010.1 spore germination cell wall hydrolase CwlJ-like protein [Anoxybacillus rupiensis]MED5053646.1 cell wall hydrolase [Anoxybacillus rupiensis]OQM44504.1 peptigoglycan-binding protein LysM [Anoxybacillus sp. UARK-01]
MIKRILAILAVVGCMVVAFTPHKSSAATTYTYYKVQKGDSFYKIAQKYKTSVSTLKTLNKKTTDRILVGETLKVPVIATAKKTTTASSAAKWKITAEERTLLAQLVQAETGSSEPFAGKVEVALVILNRVKDPAFPNTIKGVIYQKTKTGYAFVPVKTGKLTKIRPTKQDYDAVDRAVALFPSDRRHSLYFYNPAITKDRWMLSRPVTIRIGHHAFAR